ncbi:hypothetical protein ACHWQZ_G014870 [Mnemiopsis leidyi]
MNGFLKNICRREGKYKCVYSDENYEDIIEFHTKEVTGFDTLCSNDPHFYQMCNKEFGRKISNGEALCELFTCLKGDGNVESPVMMKKMPFEQICDLDCVNTDLNERECDEMVALPSGKFARPNEICNDVCDDFLCEDEGVCNGFTYGLYCERLGNISYVPPRNICKASSWCDHGEDVANCAVTDSTETSCIKKIEGRELEVVVHNNTRCTNLNQSDFRYFVEYCVKEDVTLYQTNCTDPSRVGVTCDIKGYKSTVSKYLICFDNTISACDDEIDSKCFETIGCKVHKHLLCDKKKDCATGADETHHICYSITAKTCKRRVGIGGELPIPISWINDGVWDCENGVDETGQWNTCGRGPTLRYTETNDGICENVFVCRTGNPGYVQLKVLCDGKDTCGNENEICSVSSRSFSVTTSVLTTEKGLLKRLSYCTKGLENLQRLKKRCVLKQFKFPDDNIFGGTNTSLALPDCKQSCDNMYGELYVYTSCTNRCINAACPLRNIPRYEVCPYQFKNRIGTIVNNTYLMFLTESFGTIYTNRYFVCNDTLKCIDYSQVCDLVYDCIDKSDEADCTNHFKCPSSGTLLPKTKKCDGHIDCSDLSDECNEQCSKMILDAIPLKGLSWLIGITAALANMVIIVKSVRTLKSCKTETALMNRLLIVMIAFGDFLIGCYLCTVAIYDTILLKKDYCHQQVMWITNLRCSVVGVLSTFGSQVSLFCMTGLSIIRTYGIWNSMRIPGEVTLIKILRIAAATFILILLSAVIAMAPIISKFEDFFVNGVKFSDGLRIFIGTSDKATVFSVIQAYHGRTKEVQLSWNTLIQMTREMFSHDFDYEDLTKNIAKVDFYGNDGVCLFKYFVQNEDPQRLFVWSILSLNFFCFFLISISYLIIGILSHRSSESMASSRNNQQITERNRRMNQRIAFIISTDFLCWVPFIVICMLHSLELIDATPWYGVFSMIVLPINSVFNPLLYDGTLTDVLAASLRFVSTQVKNSVIFQTVNKWLKPVQTEEVVMLDSITTAVTDVGSSNERPDTEA